MERLWSPWRMEYILASKEEPEDAECLFCRIRDGEQDERVLARSELAFVTPNRFPYSPGHLLVIPNRHEGDLESLSDEESLALQRLLQRSIAALRAEYEPHGFNVGMNLGRVAGAGVPDHLHWHVVPRWSADTSFMPVIGQTMVLPELVEETARRLVPRFDAQR
jgi:ATP adenylyltransferase